jgi:ankyrin repeat protein
MRIAAAALACAGLCLAATSADLRLVDAIKRRDHKGFAALMKAKADINAAQPDGATALSWASYLDDRESAEALIAAGAKATTKDEYGETPLTLACTTGDAALIADLLKAGANAKDTRPNGETALMIAANVGNVQAVKELIAAGADVNAAETGKGQTALMWAAAEGHTEAVQALIDAHADVKAVSKGGFNALVFAAQKNDAKAVDSLVIAGADPNYALPSGEKVLSVAAAFKAALAAGVLVDHGADPNVADRGGTTPLMTAAQTGNIDLMNKLLAKGANVDAKTAKPAAGAGRGFAGGGGGRGAPAGEQTALLLAAKANEVQAMKVLIEHHADTKAKGSDGTDLLMAAVGSGHVEAVEYAFQFDKDVNAVTDSGSTVTHVAVTGTLGNSTQPEVCKVIQFLADHGAPLDDKDGRGRTPIDVADVLPIDKAVDLLTEILVKRGTPPIHPSKR